MREGNSGHLNFYDFKDKGAWTHTKRIKEKKAPGKLP
jgi:hypothetical protein